MGTVQQKDETNKIRVRALDASGKPLARLSVELLANPTDGSGGAKSFTETIALRALSTSRDGFAIFSLGSIPHALKSTGNLAVRFGQSQDLTFPLADSIALAGSHYVSYTIDAGPGLELDAVHGPWHDDGLDADDVWAIPGVFPDLGDLEFGDEYCGRLVPSDLTVRVSNHNQVVRTGKDVVTCLKYIDEAGGKGDAHGSVDVSAGGRGDREVRLHEGEVISYEIKSARLGYTFGDLLYSLPLAPCESVTLAISHWEQRQKARAEQESVAEEKRNATYYRQNALSEAMSAVSASSHHGWAAMAGNSSSSTASASGVIYGILLKGAGAFQTTVGASASGAYDRESFASSATRNFSDRIQSSAEAWRRDHQVVIMEQSESEDQQVSYRTVCNNNHCHVLNVFYHEVLNNFRITTKMLGHREVYFVPYEVQTFDLDLALCARPFLLPFLLDESLRECYEKLKVGAAGASQDVLPVDEFKIDIVIGSALSINASNFFLAIQFTTGATQQFAIPSSGQWLSGQTYSYVVNTPNLNPDQLHNIGLIKISSGLFHHLFISSYTISVKSPATGQWVPISSGAAGPSSASTLTAMGSVTYDPPLPPEVAADQECAANVLAHLNCNAHYYNSLLWLFEDPNERICRFDKIICGTSGNTLADLIIPEPLAVMGCSVAFAKSDSRYVPYEGSPIVDERLLTLPTPGIFADAALGHCSACEKIDNGVYWDWKDTPCACGGKDVTLKTPVDTPLLQPGVAMFPTLPSAAWATMVGPATGEAAISNSLVSAFGSALATALTSAGSSSTELTQLQTLLNTMTQAVKELTPEPGSPPTPTPSPTPTPTPTPTAPE